MQCEAFETRLNQLLDRRVRPETDDHLLAHSQNCEACRELLAVQELLFDGLELLEKPELSAGFSRRVVSTVAPSRRQETITAPRWLVLAASLSAVLLVGVFAVNRFGSPTDNGEKVASPTKNDAHKSTLPGTTALINPGRRKAVPDIAPKPQPTPDSIASHDYRGLFEQFPNHLPEMPPDALEIPHGLRPITTSFGVAVGLIRRTLPGGKEEPQPPKPQAFAPRGEFAERIV